MNHSAKQLLDIFADVVFLHIYELRGSHAPLLVLEERIGGTPELLCNSGGLTGCLVQSPEEFAEDRCTVPEDQLLSLLQIVAHVGLP